MITDYTQIGIDSALHNGNYVTRFLFNGKELDNQTNMYYYGARYYEPKIMTWYGVDPLVEKYPFNGGYVYCGGNPVKYVDVDGRAPWENKNIREARQHIAASPAPNMYDVKIVDGKYGKDAHVVYLPTGKVTSTYLATANNQRSIVGNVIQTWDEGGSNDCANLGTITTADVRAVADFCEGVSDVCDAVGTICITTGVGAAIGGALYGTSTVAGYISDAVNIGTDVYEGKYRNAITRGLNGFISSKIEKTINTNNNQADKLLQKSLDKAVDAYTNFQIKQDGTNGY